MKKSVFSMLFGGLLACLLVFGFARTSDAESITNDGGRYSVMVDEGLRIGSDAAPIPGETFSAGKAQSKKYKKTKKKMKSGKSPKAPKTPKAPKATKSKKQKKSKSSKKSKKKKKK